MRPAAFSCRWPNNQGFTTEECDQYTTIVRSKTAEIVLNHPKTICP
jgi:hypothetical protein